MTINLTTAFVLAAGLGTRMRPLTDDRPKPLIEVAGRALIDHILDQCAVAGITDAIVNVHYLAAQMEHHLSHRTDPRVRISDERAALLETGGGIRHALPLIGTDPFLSLNSDSLVADPAGGMVSGLAAGFDDSRMDILLALVPTARAHGYDGSGDFHLDADGRPARRVPGQPAPYVYTGVQILHPRIFADAPAGAFSMNLLYDRALATGRLFGKVLENNWYHVGTPEAVAATDRQLRARADDSP